VAWKFIRAASDLCQTLGYHRHRPFKESEQYLRTAQDRLFWTVYSIEKGLSLRLGRPSSLRDADITLSSDSDQSRLVKAGKINGLVYDQLYSPVTLSRPDYERSPIVAALARNTQDLIDDTQAEISVWFQRSSPPIFADG
jgi:hypothetical protein